MWPDSQKLGVRWSSLGVRLVTDNLCDLREGTRLAGCGTGNQDIRGLCKWEPGWRAVSTGGESEAPAPPAPC